MRGGLVDMCPFFKPTTIMVLAKWKKNVSWTLVKLLDLFLHGTNTGGAQLQGC